MRRFIRYLYEYENGQRIRNVGFAKVEERENSTSISIHGKGLGLKGDETLKLYIFYMDENVCRGIWQGDIKNVNPALNYRLIFTEEDTGRPDNYSQIEGIILEMPENRKLAAVWNDMDVNVDEMVLWDEPENAVVEEPEDSRGSVLEQESVSRLDMDANSVARDTKLGTERECVGTCQTNFNAVPNAKGEPKGNRESVPKTEQVQEIDRYIVPSKPQIEKIDRKDIARLPRCEWRLANNSFLLHGYNNYHHLMFTEDEDGFWLGVPGIFHEKEAKAAEAFGFPRFLRIDDEEDQETGEKFGYWCRKVRRGM